ncbi:OLC1v1036490C1 [Oldenlandia corymbosa var. corymbosa]|uniref:OLC1v1036490C1 n=1 Tax=Oldenlandia corymbosa var. corymbosa TaxID=529605 RepID=A0AAV1CWK9_OLDCO|nr:OLC1v1036490C1 [Oldenlandia corymbosa var. corymbosa]
MNGDSMVLDDMIDEFVDKACLTDDVNIKLGNNCVDTVNIDHLLPNDDLSRVLIESVCVLESLVGIDIAQTNFSIDPSGSGTNFSSNDSFSDVLWSEIPIDMLTIVEEPIDVLSQFKDSNGVYVNCVNGGVNQSTIGKFGLLVSGFKGGTTYSKLSSDSVNKMFNIPACLD